MSKEDKFKNAVRTEDGKVESFVLTVGGKPFDCRCGANCFHKPNKEDLNLFACNSCDTWYHSGD